LEDLENQIVKRSTGYMSGLRSRPASSMLSCWTSTFCAWCPWHWWGRVVGFRPLEAKYLNNW